MAHSSTATKHPATKKRGGDPDIKSQPARDESKDKAEWKLEQGLEESMAGSDPISITSLGRVELSWLKSAVQEKVRCSIRPLASLALPATRASSF